MKSNWLIATPDGEVQTYTRRNTNVSQTSVVAGVYQLGEKDGDAPLELLVGFDQDDATISYHREPGQGVWFAFMQNLEHVVRAILN